MEKVTVNVYKTPSGYCAGIDILPGWAATVSGTFSELQQMVRDGIQFYIECAQADGDEYPEVFSGTYDLEYHFDVESLLAFFEGIFTKAALERMTGINQRQLSHYATGRTIPRPETARKIVNAMHSLGEELLAISV